MNVELIYDGECPNVGLARGRLIEALKQTKSALKWTEWERTDPKAPSYVSQYASPTILIDGIDVCADTSVLDGKGGCRLYRSFEGSIEGAPSFDCLLTALRRKSSHINLNGKSRASVYASLGTVIVAALPVGACPACLPAYAGILSSIGLGFAFDSVASLVLLSILLAIFLFTLLWRSNRRNGYKPFLLGLVSSFLMIIGKMNAESEPILYLGSLLLLIACIWNIWPRKKTREQPTCCQ